MENYLDNAKWLKDEKNGIVSFADRLVMLLGNENVMGILVYGSAKSAHSYHPGISDIDLYFFVDLNIISDNLINSMKCRMNSEFYGKPPMILQDAMGKRIEFYAYSESLRFDVTIGGSLVPSRENLERYTWYDNFEALMGGIYIEPLMIRGKIPNYALFQEYYLPFYDDLLRNKRLELMRNRLNQELEAISRNLEENKEYAIERILKIRGQIMRYLYIRERKYMINPDKHWQEQLSQLSTIPEQVINKLSISQGISDEFLKSVVSLLETL